MSTVKPYPHYEINVIDNSIYTVQYDEVLPIHRPVYVMTTQEGPAGVPIWCENYSKFAKMFGAQTLNEGNKKYFSPQGFFLKNSFKFNGAFVVRAVDESATTATCILEAHVKSVEVQQYEKDDNGRYILDADKKKKPLQELVGEGGDAVLENVLEPGVEITYVARYEKLNSEEEIDSLTIRSVTNDDESVTKIYPLIGFESLYPGVYGDDLAFSLYYDDKANDSFKVAKAGSIFTSLAPVRRDYGYSTVTPHRDIYDNLAQASCVKPDVIDPKTGISSSMKDILEKAYADDRILPYEMHVYENNFKLVGNRIIDVETSDEVLGFVKEEGFSAEGSTVDPVAAASEQGYLVNIYSFKNTEGIPYDHVVEGDTSVGEDSDVIVSLTKGHNIWLKGGTDGTIDDISVESAVRKFCKLDLCPAVEDEFKYPITHMYDVGFTMETKMAMLDFLDLREDIIVELSTQVLFKDADNLPITLNSEMEDEANGEVLAQYALMMRESIAKGTEVCRASIYTQAGFPIAATYDAPVPCTFWSAMKHAEYQNLSHMTIEEPRGWPASYNLLFKGDINWVPYRKASRSRLWDSGFNYCMSADMTRLFYPALRTVYPYETSALVDQWFVDAIVYTKHEIRQSWGKHTGRNDYTDVLQADITKDLENRIGTLFGGKYRFTVRVYQTAEEAKIGYIQHVAVSITAPNTNRVWDVDIIVGREGYSPEEA